MKKMILAMLMTTCLTGSLLAAPQAIVFDFGGVMTKEPDREAVVKFIRESLNLSREEFERANLEKKQALKEGKTDSQYWIEYARKKGIMLDPNWSDSLLLSMKRAINANDEMFALVKSLKAEQVTVGMLSNIDQRYAKINETFGYYELFDPCLLSYEIGVDKPNPQAFAILLERLKLPAKEIVFIDDKKENVEAAKNLGIDAILFESTDQLKKELIQRGSLNNLSS